VQVAALRRVLGNTADGQSWILTVPRLATGCSREPRHRPPPPRG
jgi:hypothetical protein